MAYRVSSSSFTVCLPCSSPAVLKALITCTLLITKSCCSGTVGFNIFCQNFVVLCETTPNKKPATQMFLVLVFLETLAKNVNQFEYTFLSTDLNIYIFELECMFSMSCSCLF